MDSVAYIYKETETVNGVTVLSQVVQVNPGQVLVEHSRFYLLETSTKNENTTETITETATVFYNREQVLRAAMVEFDRLVDFYASDEDNASTQESIISSMRN